MHVKNERIWNDIQNARKIAYKKNINGIRKIKKVKLTEKISSRTNRWCWRRKYIQSVF